jgi:SAM-dependent methyltransferase
VTPLRISWQRLQFCPPPWAIVINPNFILRRGLYTAIRRFTGLAGGRMMDFGAGSAPYRHLFKCAEYITVDIEGSGHPEGNKVATVFYDGKSLPFPDDHFDFIFSAEVLEHVFNVDEVLGELNRVLRPHGRILLSTPFAWVEHEQPYDFARYSSFGLKHLLERHGFEVQELVKTTGYIETLIQIGIVYLSDLRLVRNFKLLKLIMTVVVFAPIQIVGVLLNLLLPRNETLYLNNVVVASVRAR